MTAVSLGTRLVAVRKRRGLTQKDLATLSKVSLGTIRKLEQGEREDTRLETLRKLASALRVPTTDLITRPDGDGASQETVDQWTPVRDALMGKFGPPPEEVPTIAGVALATQKAMPLFARDQFSELGLLLPPLIRDADALGTEGRQVRSRVLHLTGWLLTQTRQFEAAEMTLKRALDDSTNRLDTAATVSTLCWLLIRQGNLRRTLDLAAQWADEIEPRMSRATPAELSAWGWLLLRHSAASVRNSEPGGADDTLSLAGAAATRMGYEYAPSADFLRTFGPITVQMKGAENAMIVDRPDIVLALSEQIPSEGLLPTSNNRNRHHLDVAKANLKMRRRAEAFEILQEIRNVSPQWIVNQRMATDIMGDIIAKRRTLTSEMREMADFLHMRF